MATRPWACKVMWVTSPSPEVSEVAVPAPSVTGPSWEMHHQLFEELAMSGDEDVGKGDPTHSGE